MALTLSGDAVVEKNQIPQQRVKGTRKCQVMEINHTSMANENGASTKLSPKQEAFVNEYLIDLNGTQAAIRVGYSASGTRCLGVRGEVSAIHLR